MAPDEIAIGVIAGMLERQTGQVLTEERKWRIGSVLTGVFREHGITSNQDLLVLLTQPEQSRLPQEVVEALLNNETYFFRDQAVFDKLASDIIPAIASLRERRKRISIWCCGCSTGQEALSLAVLFAEQRARWEGWDISILGTDVSSRAIDQARRAEYSSFQIQRGLGVTRMLRFFEKQEQGWTAIDSLRRMVRFEQHNLLEPPPFPGNFDLILCRNVLLYFDDATRRRALLQLRKGIADEGWLLLGGGEGKIAADSGFAADKQLVSLFRPADGGAGHPARAAA
ncbi:CheR family methyltransferase [Aurantiacibacter poecillastricola]|uniref:CheR family methyltransferase n=1 Tax=Aurantiacibacter poecillastricola TaxID=3064385 RepID=UPI00273D6D69|nr:protein-glutamate O-methyltransferase CheR [Aurantiacibacter sp. 219JJ12-13]MDP5260057.1 protein-glutamate O-methyltransferase CheR [Aurantiacibacter sp. 219JJ12-13]